MRFTSIFVREISGIHGGNQYHILSNLNYWHKADRGAHVYWLEKGTVEARPDHILNLIHYEVKCPSLCLHLLLFMSFG